MRATFARVISKLLEEDDKLVVMLGDIGTWAFRYAMTKYPDRVLNIGVCEQGSVSFAAGLAMAGYYPLYHTIDSFLVRRAFEQIMLDFGEQKLPGLFVTVGHDRDYAKLGPTHHCPEAPILMSQVPGMVRYSLDKPQHLEDVLTRACQERQLTYIRIKEPVHAA